MKEIGSAISCCISQGRDFYEERDKIKYGVRFLKQIAVRFAYL